MDSKYSLLRWSLERQSIVPPLGKLYGGARQTNSFDSVEGAMDNATPATTNNTRMEKRIALECGKRKPDEVESVVF